MRYARVPFVRSSLIPTSMINGPPASRSTLDCTPLPGRTAAPFRTGSRPATRCVPNARDFGGRPTNCQQDTIIPDAGSYGFGEVEALRSSMMTACKSAPSGAAAFPRMAQRPRHNSRTERWLITSWSVAGTTGWSPPVACVEELELRAAGLEYREMDPFSIAVHRDGAIRNPSNEWAPACFNAAVPPTKMRR